ncbi:type II toxin-antitoxin system prevent-host-death family antitoxin [Enterobacter ludwigii]|uniref:type II toxin-antitoxin system Phd/YefM family antitoxin n=1 Tax=Enterobacter ludwigii TaxID=299767 RepID=UPI0030766C61
MRKVSYTQMRAELSDILDAIRNGETVVVTQRGRPDTVLNGSLVHETTNFNSSPVESREHRSEYLVQTIEGKWYEMRPRGQINPVRRSKKSSFSEALNKTQLKHARIIKALEDK